MSSTAAGKKKIYVLPVLFDVVFFLTICFLNILCVDRFFFSLLIHCFLHLRMFYTTACSLFDSDGSVFYGVTFEDGEVRESVESDLVAPVGGWGTKPVAMAVTKVRVSPFFFLTRLSF